MCTRTHARTLQPVSWLPEHLRSLARGKRAGVRLAQATCAGMFGSICGAFNAKASSEESSRATRARVSPFLKAEI